MPNVLSARHPPRPTDSCAPVTKDAFAALRLTEPVENVFRVIERRGRLCRSGSWSNAKELAFEMIIVMDDNRGNWGEKFVWHVE